MPTDSSYLHTCTLTVMLLPDYFYTIILYSWLDQQ